MHSSRREAIQALQRALTLSVRRAAVPQVHERVIRRAGLDIDRVEAIALSRIVDQGEMWLSELARQLGVACSTAGRHAAHLDERGLCVRSVDPTDGRAVVATATAEGRELVTHLRSAHGEILAEVLAAWETPDLEQLASLLGRLAEDLATITEPTTASV